MKTDKLVSHKLFHGVLAVLVTCGVQFRQGVYAAILVKVCADNVVRCRIHMYVGCT